jgi:choline kinase
MTNRRYKSAEFAQTLLEILTALRVPTWTVASSLDKLSPDQIKIHKLSGSLTNAVFFASYPSRSTIKTVLVRIYGPSSSSLINRTRELRVLHVLSSQYGIGPRVFGTFENGRVEEYFESNALSISEIRDPQISTWIGARMAELHCVDVEAVEPELELKSEIAAIRNVRLWLEPATEVMRLYWNSFSAEMRAELDLQRFIDEWSRYIAWVKKWEKTYGASKRVFAHNDTQCGNLLRLKRWKPDLPDHHQVNHEKRATPRFVTDVNHPCRSSCLPQHPFTQYRSL